MMGFISLVFIYTGSNINLPGVAAPVLHPILCLPNGETIVYIYFAGFPSIVNSLFHTMLPPGKNITGEQVTKKMINY